MAHKIVDIKHSSLGSFFHLYQPQPAAVLSMRCGFSVQVCGKARMFLIHLPGSNFCRTGTPKGIYQEYRKADFRGILGKYVIQIGKRRSSLELEFCINMCMYYSLSVQRPASECGNGCMNRYMSVCTGKLADATRPDHESDVIAYIRDIGRTSSDMWKAND
jgi:hypothetical protein